MTIAHAILRTRRRVALNEPGWAMSNVGIAALTGNNRMEEGSFEQPKSRFPEDAENMQLVGDDIDPLEVPQKREIAPRHISACHLNDG